MGISRGVDKLPILFTGTFVAMSVASPIFAALAGRWPRRKLIPAAYHFFAANLVGFYLLWKLDAGRTWVPFAFYIWAAVYNLFVTSVFWSLMTDLFSSEQAKRLFGFIAAGGSLGALAGPALTSLLVTSLGGANLLILSAVLLEAASVCVLALVRWARDHPATPAIARRRRPNGPSAARSGAGSGPSSPRPTCSDRPPTSSCSPWGTRSSTSSRRTSSPPPRRAARQGRSSSRASTSS